jgi:hypothetical protein
MSDGAISTYMTVHGRFRQNTFSEHQWLQGGHLQTHRIQNERTS